MSTKTFTIHDGKIFETVIGEEIFTNDGKPTGHYKEISREQTGVLGILDDNKVKEKFRQDVLNVGKRNFSYLITGDKYIFTITRSALNGTSFIPCLNVPDALIKIIMEVGYLQSYSIQDDKMFLKIIEKDSLDNSTITLTFIPYDNFTYLATNFS